MKFAVIQSSEHSTPLSPKASRRLTAKATFERLWHQDPSQFNPEKLAKTLIQEQRVINALPLNPQGRAIDLGTGWGNTARILASKGMVVDVVDIATIPLKKLSGISNINPIEGYIPYASLDDGAYDLVLATNLIAEIPEEDRRIAVSQFASLLKPQGIALITTPLDIDAEDALPRFLALLETEFEIEELIASHFYLNQKIPLFKKSSRFQLALETASEFLFQNVGISDLIARCRLRTIN